MRLHHHLTDNVLPIFQMSRINTHMDLSNLIRNINMKDNSIANNNENGANRMFTRRICIFYSSDKLNFSTDLLKLCMRAYCCCRMSLICQTSAHLHNQHLRARIQPTTANKKIANSLI